jgi:hypothetical protein
VDTLMMIPACLPPRPVSRLKVPPPPNACDTHVWTPDRATRQRILVPNRAKLYGFPN